MKILIIIDKQTSAIDRLAKSIQRNLPHHEIVVFPVHPKRNDVETIAEAQKFMMWCDVLHIHYWKSGQVLRTTFPGEFEARPRLLFHHNPYDVENDEAKYYDLVGVPNIEMHNKVPSSHLIPHGIDLSFFKFNDTYTESQQVMMSVNRIEGKKGVKEVAIACKELGYPFKLVGRVSKSEYMAEVLAVSNGNTTFIESASDEQLRQAYYDSAIHVCNSVDNFESGTLPILEAMACGTPVLTRMIGHVPDLSNGANMVVRTGAVEDVEDLKTQLKNMMDNRAWRLTMREKAWDTVRNRDERRMALEFQQLYYRLFKPQLSLVSVIIPTKDHPEPFAECLVGALAQDYPKLEIVVADSGDTAVEQIITEVRKHTEVPIKYIPFDARGTYSLAEARNRAVIEADGEVLVFCDDRLKMKPNAVSMFLSYARPNMWVWGAKDGVIKGFVENFSCVSREDVIKHGMFNERIQHYGGMTQEVRERFENKNKMEFFPLQEAEAVGIKRATSKAQRREDIVEAKYLVYKLYQK